MEIDKLHIKQTETEGERERERAQIDRTRHAEGHSLTLGPPILMTHEWDLRSVRVFL